MNIDLNEYSLINPDSIKIINKKKKFIDIEVDGDHTFHILSKDEKIKVLTHNCDGFHITSLLINLFYKWFPSVIKNKRLSSLRTPLVTIGDGKKRRYFWDLSEYKKEKPIGNIRYLKGLGSLDLSDWEWVMNNKHLVNIEESEDSKEKLEMAFGDSSEKRKKWLSGKE